MANEVATQTKQLAFSEIVNKKGYQDSIMNALQSAKRSQSFTTAIITAVNQNPMLQECSPASIITSALLGETLKLSPSPQLSYYYLVPFNNTKKGCKEAQFQLGYKGYLQLAIRSGEYKNIVVSEIKKGELKSYNPIKEEFAFQYIEDYIEREVAETMGYYACLEYINGFKKEIYWSKEKVESHANRYSQAYRTDKKKGWTNSFWTKDFDAMAKKTMLRQLISKWGLMSTDMQRAVESDMQSEETQSSNNEENVGYEVIEQENNDDFDNIEKIEEVEVTEEIKEVSLDDF